MKQGYVYMMSNYARTTFYIGVTSNLARRVMEHKEGRIASFTRKYHLKHLVYYEAAGSMESAIRREKQLKNWHRAWKINLIRTVNPDLRDLIPEILGLDVETSSA